MSRVDQVRVKGQRTGRIARVGDDVTRAAWLSWFDPVKQKNFDRKELKKLNTKLMAQIDFTSLNAAQLNLLKTRALLLKYLDRLNTFEELNGGYGSEKARRNFQASTLLNARVRPIGERWRLCSSFTRRNCRPIDWQSSPACPRACQLTSIASCCPR